MSSKKKKKKQIHPALLGIDPKQKPTYTQVVFVAGGLSAIAQCKKHTDVDREIAKIASGWLMHLGMELYEEHQTSNSAPPPS